MPREFSLAYLTANGLAPPAMIDLAARAGYDAVGLRLIPVTESEAAFSLAEDRALLIQTKRQLLQTGIRVLDAELFRLTPECDVRAFRPVLDVCAELEVRHILAQTPDPLLSRAAGHLDALCDLAKERDLSVDIEFVTWTETPDLHRAAQIVQAAARDDAGILVDTLHFARSRCSVHELSTLPRRWFRYVQVCDAPAEKPSTDEALIFAARNERLFLGEGGLDIRSILAALPDALPCSIEIPRAAMIQEVGIEKVARLALQTTKRYLESGDPRRRPVSAIERLL
jgi:sugar phosphate isomerase/epimerase